ncbi:MAG TPA: hypothetical protein VIM65_14465 [Cyclobacteriaceae bacterium]
MPMAGAKHVCGFVGEENQQGHGLGQGYDGFQLDNRWLDGVIFKMQSDAEKSIYQAGQALRFSISGESPPH